MSAVSSVEFSEQLHKKSSADNSFLTKLRSKDKDLHTLAVSDYLNFWSQDNTDSSKEETRKNNYSQLTNNFYNLVTDFYEYGWGRSFHFCGFYPGESFTGGIARHEHYLGMKLGLTPGMKVLDVGCGVGGPAREIMHFTGAHVTGLNNNDYQLSRMRRYNEYAGLLPQSGFLKGDFMNIPLEDNSFDAAYAIEATVHAPELSGVYGEIFRILKPGARFGCYEWCMTPTYDPKDPDHLRICRAIEEGNGIPKMRTIEECMAALKKVGFEVETSYDVATSSKLPWYKPLKGGLMRLPLSSIGRVATDYFTGFLEKLYLAPEGTRRVNALLNLAADACLEGGEKEIFTPMYFFIAKKPESS